MRSLQTVLIAVALASGCSETPVHEPAMAAPVDDPSTREAKSVSRYVLDGKSSEFTAKVEVGGLLSRFGHDHLVAMRDLSGEARFDPETLNGARLRLSIRADSVVEIGKEFNEEER